MQDTQYLEGFIRELLHINDVSDNKLIDLTAVGGGKTYFLQHACADLCAYALTVASQRIGKTANTILLDSAAVGGGEQRVARHVNTFSWADSAGCSNTKELHAFIAKVKKEAALRGNNPLFLSVGALRWKVAVNENGKEVLKEILSPVLVFPVRLVTAANTAPVTIEFIDDDVYLNPCLIAKLEQTFGKEVADGFPHPNGTGVDGNCPVDMARLAEGNGYFALAKAYCDSCVQGGGSDTVFTLEKDVVALAQYNHSEICTYYDIRRNRDKIYNHPLIERIFSPVGGATAKKGGHYGVMPLCVLPTDSVQSSIISRVISGENLIVKGPPGTGKTNTIANLIAALMGENKRVLFASKKISALTEVYAKLPERLRKFTMLLDGETESAAAKINVAEVKADFKRLLTARKQFKESPLLATDRAQANAEKAAAMQFVSRYADLVFNDRTVAGVSFYDAIDFSCRTDMPVVHFTTGEKVSKVSRTQYGYLLSKTEECGKHYAELTDGFKKPIYECPWFGVDVKCDVEGAMKELVAISGRAEETAGLVKGALKDFPFDGGELTLREAQVLCRCELPQSAVLAACDEKNTELIEKIVQSANAYAQAFEGAKACELGADGETARKAAALEACKADGELTVEEVGLIAAGREIFYPAGKFLSTAAIKALYVLAEKISELSNKKQELLAQCAGVFGEISDGDKQELLLSSSKIFAAYSGAEKPKALDLRAKKHYKKLCAISFLSSPSFGETVKASGAYCAAGGLQTQIDACVQDVYRYFHAALSEERLRCALTVAYACGKQSCDAARYIDAVCAAAGLIKECAEEVGADGGVTLAQLKKDYVAAYRLGVLKADLNEFATRCECEKICPFGGEIAAAEGLYTVKNLETRLTKSGCSAADITGVIAVLRGLEGQIARPCAELESSLENFGKNYFINNYVILGGDNALNVLAQTGAAAGDRHIIAAAINYYAAKNDPDNALNLAEFFYRFESGEAQLPNGVSFAQAFERSFFGLAVEERNAELGLARNGLGARLTGALEKIAACDEKINGYNAQVVESRCFSRIDPADGDFTFVHDSNSNENLRLTFKRHGEAVLKLQRCLIISPYTASLLFATDEFSHFDVLVVDEASQLEPALLLPVLLRASNCVIVGDEWQMPPIKHFVSLAPASQSEEGFGALEPEISALSLALRCGAFPVEELVCHYRSRTETLIRFSQRAFYPNMRTFPAPVPARLPEKGVVGLGFKDVFVEGATVSEGVNAKEAAKVVEELNAHFDNYYDEESKTLTMPVGVIAFGQTQCDEIIRRVNLDKKLSAKINAAIESFGDVTEKLIFFKTIETVQGQETGHVILSLTHGRRANGLNMNFGQLNRGKLGRCIFNVAVTRAQNMVTVVHSVRAAEIYGETVGYIRDYLQTVERFATLGESQFLSGEEPKGFLTSVADYIISCGVEKERVMFNYGVTDGSVRIPIAVLSKNLSTALLGVWCEKPTGNAYDYLDYNMRYVNVLKACGWHIHTICAQDWADDRKGQKAALKKALDDIEK